jgi:transposase-like protein
MRRSRFMQNEILQLLGEANAGVPVADICEAAGVTPRTFYRWRRQFGGLDVPAVRQMKDLVSENQRLRGLVKPRPPLGPTQGRAIRCERAVLPRKNVAARSPDILLPSGSIAEAGSADFAGHPDISGDLAVSHFRAHDGCLRCRAAISLCAHMDAPKDSVTSA